MSLSSVIYSDFSLSPFLNMMGRASAWEVCRNVLPPGTQSSYESAALILGHRTSRMILFPSVSGWPVFIPSLYTVCYVPGTHLHRKQTPASWEVLSMTLRLIFGIQTENKLGHSICRLSCHGRHCGELAWAHRRKHWLRAGESNS